MKPSAVVRRSHYLEADELGFGEAVAVDNLDLFEQGALAALRGSWHTRTRSHGFKSSIISAAPCHLTRNASDVVQKGSLISPSMRILTTLTSLLACSYRSCSIFELFIFAFLLSSLVSC